MSSAVSASGRSSSDLTGCQCWPHGAVLHSSYEDGSGGADSCTGEKRPYFAAAAFFLGVWGESKPSLPFVLPLAKDVRLCVDPFELVWACEWE